jgi:hypothetical protein
MCLGTSIWRPLTTFGGDWHSAMVVAKEKFREHGPQEFQLDIIRHGFEF